MDELTERFQRGLDELVQRGARQGRQQGQAMVLRRLIARRFGEATAGQVSDAVEELTGNEGIDKVTDALFECGTGDEFIERVRTAWGSGNWQGLGRHENVNYGVHDVMCSLHVAAYGNHVPTSS